jgi:hypothetical protein
MPLDPRVAGGDILPARVARPAKVGPCYLRQSGIATGAAILACSVLLVPFEAAKPNHIDENRAEVFHLMGERVSQVAGAAAASRRFSTCSRARATWLFRMKSRCA